MKIEEDFETRLVQFRRDLHRHPELPFREKQPADTIARALERLGISCVQVAQTGIVADIPGSSGSASPKVAIRADIDALPIHEETGLEFASVNEGVMHACNAAGIGVGTDIVLLGCDCSAWDAPGLPRITSLEASWRQAGQLAMRQLLEMRNTGNWRCPRTLLEPIVVAGDTCPVQPT